MGALCETEPMRTDEAMGKLARLHINGRRVFNITRTGSPEEPAVNVEYLLRDGDLPGNVHTLWRALYIRLHELAGSPLPAVTITYLNRASSHNPAVINEMAATLELGDTVH